MYTIRGNRRNTYTPADDTIDPTWTAEDHARARTVAARLASKGVGEQDLEQLIRCIVWKAKFPGLQYEDTIEERIRSFAVGA